MNPKLIYIDVCSLSRPFDDQDYLRIRMETDAVTLILSRARQGIYRLLTSPVHLIEINAIEDAFERIQLLTLLEKLGENINVDMMETRKRAEELVNLGFGIADAAHVAFVEKSGADFISCDDRLIRKCLKYKIRVWCGNPVGFCDKEDLK